MSGWVKMAAQMVAVRIQMPICAMIAVPVVPPMSAD